MAAFDRTVLRRPRWILAVVVAVALAAVFVRLAVWQLDRLEERRQSNALIEERAAAPARPLDELIGAYGSDPSDLVYRSAIVEGRYRTDLEFVSIGRTYGEDRGTLVLTPLELRDGSLMVVARGLVPPDVAGPPAELHAPPSGVVLVTGRIDDGEEPLRIGEPDPEDGVLTSLSRVDLAFVDTWIDGDVLPVSLLLDASDPAPPGAVPTRIPSEELSEGSHLGYAVQWFGFALVVVVGVAYLVYRAGSREVGSISESAQERASTP